MHAASGPFANSQSQPAPAPQATKGTPSQALHSNKPTAVVTQQKKQDHSQETTAPAASVHGNAAKLRTLSAARQEDRAGMPTSPGAGCAGHPLEGSADPKAAASRPVIRWPGSSTQGASADANDLHGVAATAVKARRSKSCSATGRQHTAKRLVFQQLRLADQPSVPVSLRLRQSRTVSCAGHVNKDKQADTTLTLAPANEAIPAQVVINAAADAVWGWIRLQCGWQSGC